MDKIIPLIDLTKNSQQVYQLNEDGDRTRELSSIISGTQEKIADGPLTKFRIKKTGQEIY